jgi:putative peptide zinc metalloprotease protein
MTESIFTSNTARPLALTMRRDLVVRRQRWQGREYWTVKDPLALKYYRFEEEEFAILSMLDGGASIDSIRERFEREHAPQRLTAAQLQHLLTMLHRSNLLVADAPGQGNELLKRERARIRKHRLATAANFLALRFRGIDPDWLLDGLNQKLGWVFSLPAAAGALSLMIAALLLVAAEFDTFRSRLPTFDAFFAAQNWLWMAVTLCGTKVLHELGHGLACKRFGGKCHEMGVMLLVFTPCLYCNVSDAWMIPSKWRRAAIGAAGMYVELVLAAVCTFLWWLSEPGLFNHLCLNVMFVSSVSTLLFNANPLMRFDGYYILSDLIEIPNLRQKSSAVIQRKLGKWLLGLRERPDPFLPVRRRWLFAAYSIASTGYGWLVTLSIFWFFYRVLEPYGLKVVGQLLGLAMIGSLVVLPLVRLVRFLLEPARPQDVNKMRAVIGFGSMGLVAAALLCVPLPYYVAATFEVQPRDAASVYVEMPGELKQIHLAAGATAVGQPIAELADIDARLAVERLQAQRAEIMTRIDSIRQRAHTDDSALLELAQTEETHAALNKQIARLEEDLARLVIRAPIAGIVVPPPSREQPERSRLQLASWAGRPLDNRNVGAFLEASTLVCRVAQPGKFEAILAIDQAELDFVRAGQAVDLLLASRPGERWPGQIDHVAEQNMEAAPTRMAARTGGQLATRADPSGIERPLSVVYQASVPLDDESGQIIVGASGLARIHAGYQPLGQRFWRAACRTFHFEM